MPEIEKAAPNKLLQSQFFVSKYQEIGKRVKVKAKMFSLVSWTSKVLKNLIL
jgi:hypothetical protein